MSNDFVIGVGLLALSIVLTLALGVAATVVWPEYRRRLLAENQKVVADLIEQIMVAAVAHAEQTAVGNEAKKRVAIRYAERELRRYGIQMDLDQIADQVEAAVYQYLNHLARQFNSK